jgi:hypothetical protein
MEGTIIQGTLRPEDLIPAFYNALVELAPERAEELKTGEYDEEIEDALAGRIETYEAYYGSAVAGQYLYEAVELLGEALDDYAPEGFYFGVLDGDGTDFGFWKVED